MLYLLKIMKDDNLPKHMKYWVKCIFNFKEIDIKYIEEFIISIDNRKVFNLDKDDLFKIFNKLTTEKYIFYELYTMLRSRKDLKGIIYALEKENNFIDKIYFDCFINKEIQEKGLDYFLSQNLLND